MNKRNYLSLLLILSILLGIEVQGCTSTGNYGNKPKFLNLDFEDSTPNGYPVNWFVGGVGFKASIDSNVFYSGHKSLRLTKISNGKYGVGTSTFPVNAAIGKHITFTGYIKTKDVKNGYAGLWWRVDGKNRVTIGFGDTYDQGAVGTTNWKNYKIDIDVNKNAISINFGVILSGSGTAWFDDLIIKINGKEYKQIPPKPFVPSEKQLSWIRNNAVTFMTSEPGNELKDLAGLNKIIGNARIISLGEGTHGTSEFFKMKDRIVRYVAEKYKNVVFAMEANMPEARRVNNYIATGKGNPKAAIEGMYFWTWDTQEMLNMVEWMRKYNLSKKGKIQFWGFDSQTPTVAIKNVETFIRKYDSNYIDSVNFYYNPISKIFNTIIYNKWNWYDKKQKAERWYNLSVNVMHHLIKNRAEYLKSDDSSNVDWIIQNAKIVEQGAGIYIHGVKFRDSCMASNAEWIINHSPKNTKIVLWAHNGHIRKLKGWMGSYLYKKYGSKIVNFGQLFYSGNYTAIGLEGNKGLNVFKALNAQPGSLEYAFHETGMRRFIIDLRKVSNNPSSNWLDKTLEHRSIGAAAENYAFYPAVITKYFDAVIFFDKTTASHILYYTNSKFTFYPNNF